MTLRQVSGSQTATGNYKLSPPSAKKWILKKAGIRLTTGATAGTRSAEIDINYPSLSTQSKLAGVSTGNQTGTSSAYFAFLDFNASGLLQTELGASNDQLIFNVTLISGDTAYYELTVDEVNQ